MLKTYTASSTSSSCSCHRRQDHTSRALPQHAHTCTQTSRSITSMQAGVVCMHTGVVSMNAVCETCAHDPRLLPLERCTQNEQASSTTGMQAFMLLQLQLVLNKSLSVLSASRKLLHAAAAQQNSTCKVLMHRRSKEDPRGDQLYSKRRASSPHVWGLYMTWQQIQHRL